jgi:hypothetical protein
MVMAVPGARFKGEADQLSPDGTGLERHHQELLAPEPMTG